MRVIVLFCLGYYNGNGSPIQYSCLENPMDRGTWGTEVHGVAEWDMTERLCTVQQHHVPSTFPGGRDNRVS